MNSMWKRSFALLLSLVMVFGMVPVNAFAEDSGAVTCDGTAECQAVADHAEGCLKAIADAEAAAKAAEEAAAKAAEEAAKAAAEAANQPPVCNKQEDCPAAENHAEDCLKAIAEAEAAKAAAEAANQPPVCNKQEDCPAAENHAEDCLKAIADAEAAKAAEEAAAKAASEAAAVVCDGTENCTAETHETTCECYDWCAALGCSWEVHHDDCPWGPCTLTEGCELVKNHPGECTGADTFEEFGLAGEGTQESPYLIQNLEDLVWFRDDVDRCSQDGSSQYADKYIKLTTDIDLDGINWEPIGSTTKDHGSFYGSFDGDGHTISNLYVEKAGTGLGFFAKTSGGETGPRAQVKNLIFNNVKVKTTNNSSYVAAVIGNAGSNTYVENVHVTGSIEIIGKGYVGAIVGHGYPDIRNCSVDGGSADKSIISAATHWCVGGIVGYSGNKEGPETINCSVKNVTINSAIYGAGAVIGLGHYGEIKDITAENVVVKAASEPDANGALVGCNYGAITGTSWANNVTVIVANETVSVPQDVEVAIGTKYYNTIQAAVNNGGEVTLLKDVTVSETINVNKPVTLNLNGKTITNNVDGGRVFHTTADMVIDGSVAGSQVIGGSSSYGLVRMDNCSLTVDGGTYKFDTVIGAMFKAAKGVCDLTVKNATVETNYHITNHTNTDGILVGCFGDVVIEGGSYKTTGDGNVCIVATNATLDGATVISEKGPAVEIADGTGTVTNCTITCKSDTTYASAGMPGWALAVSSGANVTVNSGTFTGVREAAGIGSTGGTMNIMGGTFNDDIYLTASIGKTSTCNISGGTIHGELVKSNKPGESEGTMNYIVTGGTFENNVKAYLAPGYAQDSETGKVDKEITKENVQEKIDESDAIVNPPATGLTEESKEAANAQATVNNSTEGLVDAVDPAKLAEAVEALASQPETAGATPTVTLIYTPKETTDGNHNLVSYIWDITPAVVAVDSNDQPVGEPVEIPELIDKRTIVLTVPFTTKYVNVVHTHTAPDGTVSVIQMGDVEVVGGKVTLELDKFSEVEFTPVDSEGYVAKIGDIQYTTLQGAINAANNGDTIKLIANIENITATISSSVTLDLNGYSARNGSNTITVVTNGNLTMKDSNPTIINGAGNSFGGNITVDGGVFTLESGCLNGYDKVLTVARGTAEIKGGIVSVGLYDATAISVTGGKLKVSDGDINGQLYSIQQTNDGEVEICGGMIESQMSGNRIQIPGLVEEKLNPAIFTHFDPTSFCEERYAAYEYQENIYKIIPAAASVTNGNVTTYYPTVADAVNATGVNNTLTIIADTKDANKDAGVTKNSTMTIAADDKGGVKITATAANGLKYGVIQVNGVTYRVDIHTGNVTISAKGIAGGNNVKLDENGKPVYSLVPQKNINNYLSGTNATLTFESNMLFDTFTKAYLDGSEIVLNKDYVAERGSTIITLANARLRTLSAGKHILTIKDDMEQTISREFYVTVNANADKTNPKTGDEIFVPMFVMFSTAAALAVLVMGKKKYF